MMTGGIGLEPGDGNPGLIRVDSGDWGISGIS